MTFSNIRLWEGEEWEKYIQLLLKRHYGPGNYQEIPAKHCGDFGIEGYSTEGHTYQCYAPSEPCTTQHRYELQRDKITTDIGKFIRNKSELIKVFGGTVISRWILVVPVSESATLVQHASKKAEEVLKAGLPYVSNNFKIIVSTDSCFEKEKKELTNIGLIDIHTPSVEIEPELRESWLETNNKLVNNLNYKAKKISKLSDNERIEKFKHLMIDNYLQGQNLLESLNKNYPDLYATIDNCKRSHERYLEMMSSINDNPANQHLSQALKEYESNLQKSIPNLPPATIQKLSCEAVSDWLMRCPLNF
ncbi:hypothetical protein H6G54_29005 [Anabaena cylindrica FACHB-243]|uniref:Uncharacterized protein n=1 Tax=Anabaena cylindrica (strain ATCC 27899 / PCC 7122) TaxID=272123 RepID=K9ZQW2_ANACC|nr:MULTISPECIES: hypothetical protein [Anabaena]AFZ61169.1 hypothetical protein Anacy_5878 [Anabaena cylindrica PCC 7122]MBD2421645.1 hypothetical protein [Anabaena cylindrica FACHB-243]MBY5280456.1 hypothetical protein [Anabaena sp. CCAP 1446/1C]MBY5308187.1 hypothetical protein [Anabaena sp. CCAP 1446/1C]MCM2405453.1 hypothetical protein [Anabaena sp. CCAP 1446/1C]